MKDINLSHINTVFFLGIGGIGMSAIARYFLHEGARVIGYDKTPSPLTAALEKEGAVISYEDDISQFANNADLIIYTPAVPRDTNLYQEAVRSGITLFKRSEILGLMSREMFTVAVAGTHGKTSITSLISYILKENNFAFNAFIGGIVSEWNTNIHLSEKAEVLVVEADEFDRSFHRLSPDIAVISSMDADHLDIYGNHQQLLEDFNHFASRLPEDGVLIHRKGLPLKSGGRAAITYAFDEEADYTASLEEIQDHKISFRLNDGKGNSSEMQIAFPGKHSIENAVAAVLVCRKLGMSEDGIRKALSNFRGVKRRFETRFSSEGKTYIDDYAHHPEEIKVTVDALRMLYPEQKVLGIFQPHLYSRTRDFVDGFARSLSLLDEVVLLPIYPAREKPIEGVNSEMLLERMPGKKVCVVQKSELLDVVMQSECQLILTLGAGDIDRFAEPIENALREKYEE